MKRIIQSAFSLFMVVGVLAFYIPQASSVVQNVSVVDTSGQPVKGQIVTINFPAGVTDDEGRTSSTAETDDEGGFFFDFPGDGDYRIDYEGGSMTYTVKGGIPTSVKVGGAIVALAGAYALIDNDNDNDDTNSNSGSSSGGNGSTSSSGGEGSSSSGVSSSASSSGTGSSSSSSSGTTSSASSSSSGADPDGPYTFTSTTETDNECDHPISEISAADIEISMDCTSASFEIPGGGTSVSTSGSCDAQGPYSWTGIGMFAGFSGVDFLFMGTFDAAAGTFSGSGVIGDNGVLPDGCPLGFDFDAERDEPGT